MVKVLKRKSALKAQRNIAAVNKLETNSISSISEPLDDDDRDPDFNEAASSSEESDDEEMKINNCLSERIQLDDESFLEYQSLELAFNFANLSEKEKEFRKKECKPILSKPGPFSIYLSNLNMWQKALAPNEIAAWYYQSYDKIRALCLSQPHVFSARDHNEERILQFSNVSQSKVRIMFPQDVSAWTSLNPKEYPHYLPICKSSMAYEIIDSQPAQGNTQSVLHLFGVDQENGLIFTGGFVRSMDWATLPLGAPDDAPNFLAVTTYRSPDELNYCSEIINSSKSCGLIQIWKVDGLNSQSQRPHASLHMGIAHNWGVIHDLQWLPQNPAQSEHHRSSISLVGHLLLACADGLVRIVPIPAIPPPKIEEQPPIYQVDDRQVLKLGMFAKCSQDESHYLGYPTCLTCRPEFPYRIVAGFNLGHAVIWDLRQNFHLYYDAEFSYMGPVGSVRLVKSPVFAVQIHPMDENVFVVTSLNRENRVYDANDRCYSQAELLPFYTGLMRTFVWPARSDLFICADDDARSGHDHSAVFAVPPHCIFSGSFRSMKSESAVMSLASNDYMNGIAYGTVNGRLALATYNYFLGYHNKKRIHPKNQRWIAQQLTIVPRKMKEAEPTPNDESNVCDCPEHERALCYHHIIKDCCLCECSPETALICYHQLHKNYAVSFNSESCNRPSQPADPRVFPACSINSITFNPNKNYCNWLAFGTLAGFIRILSEGRFENSDLMNVDLQALNTDIASKFTPKYESGPKKKRGRPPKRKAELALNIDRMSVDTEPMTLETLDTSMPMEVSDTESNATEPLRMEDSLLNTSEDCVTRVSESPVKDRSAFDSLNFLVQSTSSLESESKPDAQNIDAKGSENVTENTTILLETAEAKELSSENNPNELQSTIELQHSFHSTYTQHLANTVAENTPDIDSHSIQPLLSDTQESTTDDAPNSSNQESLMLIPQHEPGEYPHVNDVETDNSPEQDNKMESDEYPFPIDGEHLTITKKLEVSTTCTETTQNDNFDTTSEQETINQEGPANVCPDELSSNVLVFTTEETKNSDKPTNIEVDCAQISHQSSDQKSNPTVANDSFSSSTEIPSRESETFVAKELISTDVSNDKDIIDELKPGETSQSVCITNQNEHKQSPSEEKSPSKSKKKITVKLLGYNDQPVEHKKRLVDIKTERSFEEIVSHANDTPSVLDDIPKGNDSSRLNDDKDLNLSSYNLSLAKNLHSDLIKDTFGDSLCETNIEQERSIEMFESSHLEIQSAPDVQGNASCTQIDRTLRDITSVDSIVASDSDLRLSEKLSVAEITTAVDELRSDTESIEVDKPDNSNLRQAQRKSVAESSVVTVGELPNDSESAEVEKSDNSNLRRSHRRSIADISVAVDELRSDTESIEVEKPDNSNLKGSVAETSTVVDELRSDSESIKTEKSDNSNLRRSQRKSVAVDELRSDTESIEVEKPDNSNLRRSHRRSIADTSVAVDELRSDSESIETEKSDNSNLKRSQRKSVAVGKLRSDTESVELEKPDKANLRRSHRRSIADTSAVVDKLRSDTESAETEKSNNSSLRRSHRRSVAETSVDVYDDSISKRRRVSTDEVNIKQENKIKSDSDDGSSTVESVISLPSKRSLRERKPKNEQRDSIQIEKQDNLAESISKPLPSESRKSNAPKIQYSVEWLEGKYRGTKNVVSQSCFKGIDDEINVGQRYFIVWGKRQKHYECEVVGKIIDNVFYYDPDDPRIGNPQNADESAENNIKTPKSGDNADGKPAVTDKQKSKRKSTSVLNKKCQSDRTEKGSVSTSQRKSTTPIIDAKNSTMDNKNRRSASGRLNSSQRTPSSISKKNASRVEPVTINQTSSHTEPVKANTNKLSAATHQDSKNEKSATKPKANYESAKKLNVKKAKKPTFSITFSKKLLLRHKRISTKETTESTRRKLTSAKRTVDNLKNKESENVNEPVSTSSKTPQSSEKSKVTSKTSNSTISNSSKTPNKPQKCTKNKTPISVEKSSSVKVSSKRKLDSETKHSKKQRQS